MELFSFIEADTVLLVSASGSNLFLHPVHNEHFGHPFPLCSGYKNGFSGCVFNNTLHYAYINKENSLLLRRLNDSSPLFRLNSSDTLTYQAPQLIGLNHLLFLFYFEKEYGSYHLKLQSPLTDTELPLPEIFQTHFEELPALSLQITNRYLYLFLTTGTTTVSYRYSPITSFEPLSSPKELLSELQVPWEAEKKQLEHALLQAVHLSEQQQDRLVHEEQKLSDAETRFSRLSIEAEQTNTLLTEASIDLQNLKAKLKESEQNKQQAEQNLQQTTLLLERAKAQYNELMQVAEQYRQEAVKWYGKFTDRR